MKNLTVNEKERVLIIGGGSDNLQQGGELDYATLEVGSTMVKKGYETILVNDNPFSAALDTKEAITDAVIKPLTNDNIVNAIHKYHPSIIIPSLGGRHAFELLQTLMKTGILTEENIKIAGVPEATIRQINNSVLLNQTLRRLSTPTKKIVTVDNYQEAKELAEEVGYPVVVRSAFPRALRMRRIVQDDIELQKAVSDGIKLSRSGQVSVQQSLAGLKEIEVLVVRDGSGNMMQLAMVEDVDPIGIHAGDSVAVLPTQTLLDRQIQDMRNAAFAITRKLRIVGINHVQFAFDVHHDRFYVIKNSPYFDRISSFVETATGYPIARVVGHLYAGEYLRNIHLDHGLTKHTAVTEPILDRTAVRLPVFPYDSLNTSNQILSTQKRSIGTSIGIGRSFIEAIMKAASGYRLGLQNGQVERMHDISTDRLDQLLIHPQGDRIFTYTEALRRGYTSKELAELTKIDRYYFDQLHHLSKLEDELKDYQDSPVALKEVKYWGFSDEAVADVWKIKRTKVLALRHEHQINRVYKEVDPSAGEFDQQTNSFYSTFEIENESQPSHKPVAVIVGSGVRKLGNGTANDFLIGLMMHGLKAHGYNTVVIDNNPNSIVLSSLYSDKRYIEPLISETVEDIINLENPELILVPANQPQLIANLQEDMGDDPRMVLLPVEDQEDVVSSAPLLEYNALYDGDTGDYCGTSIKRST